MADDSTIGTRSTNNVISDSASIQDLDLRKLSNDQVRLMKPRRNLAKSFQHFRISDSRFLEEESDRCRCEICGQSRKYFCYSCHVPLQRFRNRVPQVQLPFRVDILKHAKEVDGKSTAIHAAILAPQHVTLYTYPHIPDYRNSEDNVVLIFPGPKSSKISELLPCVNNPAKERPLPFDRAVLVDCTWNQVKRIILDERVAGLPRVELSEHETLFWRYQTGKPSTYLATIEALYYFVLDAHKFEYHYSSTGLSAGAEDDRVSDETCRLAPVDTVEMKDSDKSTRLTGVEAMKLKDETSSRLTRVEMIEMDGPEFETVLSKENNMESDKSPSVQEVKSVRAARAKDSEGKIHQSKDSEVNARAIETIGFQNLEIKNVPNGQSSNHSKSPQMSNNSMAGALNSAEAKKKFLDEKSFSGYVVSEQKSKSNISNGVSFDITDNETSNKWNSESPHVSDGKSPVESIEVSDHFSAKFYCESREKSSVPFAKFGETGRAHDDSFAKSSGESSTASLVKSSLESGKSSDETSSVPYVKSSTKCESTSEEDTELFIDDCCHQYDDLLFYFQFMFNKIHNLYDVETLRAYK